MKITNEERRKIAAELRSLDEFMLREREHLAICHIVGCWSHGKYLEMTLKDRLADLIEPEPERHTCYVESSHFNDCFHDWSEYETELSCGHTWSNCYDAVPKFCPECGCRVRSDDK